MLDPHGTQYASLDGDVPVLTRRKTLEGAFWLSAWAFLGSEALSACSPLDRLKPVPEPLRPRHFIDVHSHIFNAADVPIADFIRKVTLAGDFAGSVADSLGIIAAVSAIITNAAPTDAQEQARLAQTSKIGLLGAGTQESKLAAGLRSLTTHNSNRDNFPGVNDSSITQPPNHGSVVQSYIDLRQQLAGRSLDEVFEDTEITPSPSPILVRVATSPYGTFAHHKTRLFQTGVNQTHVRLLSALTLFKLFGTGGTREQLLNIELKMADPASGAAGVPVDEHTRVITEAVLGYNGQVEAIVERISELRVKNTNQRGPLESATAFLSYHLGLVDQHAWEIAYLLRWAAGFTRYRFENGLALSRLFPAESSAPESRRIYAHAMVDYEFWLDKNAGLRDRSEVRSTLNGLVSVYETIAKRDFGDALFLGFAPFDPLRAVLATQLRGKLGEHPLSILKRAIETQGFVGAKVYPTMGFLPYGNADLAKDDLSFGPTVRALLQRADIAPLNLAPEQLGALLDAELLDLYQFCINNDVPIIAHTGGAIYPFDEAKLRSDPKHWQRVLELSIDGEKKFQGLRLNLGHFGGFWCLGKARASDLKRVYCAPLGDNETAQDFSDDPSRLNQTWTAAIADLLVATVDGSPKYPNLFADIADFFFVSNPFQHEERDLLQTNLDLLLKLEAPDGGSRMAVFDRLMYGTDWLLVAREVGFEDYFRGVVPFIHTSSLKAGFSEPEAREIIEKLMWKNAARFLGIRSENGGKPKTRQRLEEFYKGDQRKLEFLSAFDDDAKREAAN